MPNVIRDPCDEGVILARKTALSCTETQSRWILAATILASSMAFIDGTVVNVALPALQKNLQATAIGMQWVVEAYSLLLSALLLVGGSLGDHYGRKRVFLMGVSHLRSGFCLVRTRAQYRTTHRGASRAGCWRRTVDSREPGDY